MGTGTAGSLEGNCAKRGGDGKSLWKHSAMEQSRIAFGASSGQQAGLALLIE